MTNEFFTTIFSREGFLGRREFFINTLYTSLLISPIWMIIYFISMFPNIENANNIIVVLTIINGIVGTLIMIPSFIRRLYDINGKENKNQNIIFISVLLLSQLFTLKIDILYLVPIVGYLYLLCKKGQLSSKIPHNIENEFNWGAYFGTWIWGLVNNSYITLWIIPIYLTPLAGIFALICGFHGNKWAAQNRDWNSVQEFRQAQEKQTLIFVILSVLVLPILIIMLFAGLIGGYATMLIKEGKKNPEKATKKIEKLENDLHTLALSQFESHKITLNENIFYINPQEWENMPYRNKRKTLDLAASTARLERKQRGFKTTTKVKELTRTKIYNSENKELLAEYSIAQSIYEDSQDVVDTMVAINAAYKIYNPTQKKKGN